MGPQATELFYQWVIQRTAARSDQEHIPTLILSDTQMPDRTQAILSGDTALCRERLLSGARVLTDWGAGVIAIPCNTSHAFLPWLQERVEGQIIDMIGQTAARLQTLVCKRAAILATDGTIRLGLYHAACAAVGVEAVSPPPAVQKMVMELIYGQIKQGQPGDPALFSMIDAGVRALGCDRAVLACTELSVYRQGHSLPEFYVDAMDVLARRCVEACGYPLKER